MITARQHVYLERMGIDVWVRREPGETPNAAKDEVIVDALPIPSIDTESMDWQTLEQHVSVCTRCPLHSGRKHTVFGTGNRSAEGDNEQKSLKPALWHLQCQGVLAFLFRKSVERIGV